MVVTSYDISCWQKVQVKWANPVSWRRVRLGARAQRPATEPRSHTCARAGSFGHRFGPFRTWVLTHLNTLGFCKTSIGCKISFLKDTTWNVSRLGVLCWDVQKKIYLPLLTYLHYKLRLVGDTRYQTLTDNWIKLLSGYQSCKSIHTHKRGRQRRG